MMESPPKAVLLTGIDEPGLTAFLPEVQKLQGTGSVANWTLHGPASQLVRYRKGYRLRPPHDPSVMAMLRRLTIEEFTDVKVEFPLTTSGLASVQRLCVILPAAPVADDRQAEIDKLDAILSAVTQLDKSQLDGILVVMVDALKMLSTPPPPLDEIDAWSRLRDGLDVGRPPMELSPKVASWFEPFQRMDKAWSERLTALLRLAQASHIDFATIPISFDGFHTATGMVQIDPADRARSVPYNVSVLAQALNMPRLGNVANCLMQLAVP